MTHPCWTSWDEARGKEVVLVDLSEKLEEFLVDFCLLEEDFNKLISFKL